MQLVRDLRTLSLLFNFSEHRYKSVEHQYMSKKSVGTRPCEIAVDVVL